MERTIQEQVGDAVWESWPVGARMAIADAQATIAALQARVQELEEWKHNEPPQKGAEDGANKYSRKGGPVRGTQAKALRRRVYGEGGSSRIRAYFKPDGREYRPADYSYHVTDHKGRVIGVARRLWRNGATVVADTQRQVYQRMKKGHFVGQFFGRWITAER